MAVRQQILFELEGGTAYIAIFHSSCSLLYAGFSVSYTSYTISRKYSFVTFLTEFISEYAVNQEERNFIRSAIVFNAVGYHDTRNFSGFSGEITPNCGTTVNFQ